MHMCIRLGIRTLLMGTRGTGLEGCEAEGTVGARVRPGCKVGNPESRVGWGCANPPQPMVGSEHRWLLFLEAVQRGLHVRHSFRPHCAQPTANQCLRQPTGSVYMGSPYFNAEYISGLRNQAQVSGPGSRVNPWKLDPNLGQNPACKGPGGAQNPGPFSVHGPKTLHVWSVGPQTFAIR